MNIIIVVGLVILSGLFSGLTLGLLSLSTSQLQRKISLGDTRANKIYEVRRNGNFLLCTLLLGNVAVNSALSIFLGSMTAGAIAMVVSTGLIVVFGEILPQAAISRHALAVGSRTVWLVKTFQFLLWPVVWPMARGLDWMLGKELPSIWSKQEIERLVEFHEDHPQSSIDADEERIIKGALHFSETKVEQIMTKKDVVFKLDIRTTLDIRVLNKIKEKGFTRIPVYKDNENNIVGILYTKQLIGLKRGTPVKNLLRQSDLLRVPVEEKLDVLLNRLMRKRRHMAFVYDKSKKFTGIATLEDIIEEILKREIIDEYDNQ